MTTESCPIRLESSAYCLKVFKNSHMQGRTLTNKNKNCHEIKGTAE
jgi:hypothetical protein